MTTLDNLLSLLAEWGPWKRIQETPARVDGLEARIAELESKLRPGRVAGQPCPSCGALEFRVVGSKPDPVFGDLGGVRRLMKCGECGFEEAGFHDTGSR